MGIIKSGKKCILFFAAVNFLCLSISFTAYAATVEERKQALKEKYSLTVEKIDTSVWDEDVALTMLEEALLKYPQALLREMFEDLTLDGTKSITTAEFIAANPNYKLVVASWTPVDDDNIEESRYKMEFMPKTTTEVIVHELAHCLDHYYQLSSGDSVIIKGIESCNHEEPYVGLQVYDWDMTQKQEQAFISKYACTNLYEDWAEVITHMAIASPEIKNHLFWEPNGPIAQKMEFIYSLNDKYGSVDLREFWNIPRYVDTSPSSWAIPYYERALNEGVIPHKEGFIGSHTKNINRMDFCYLIADLIESQTGKMVSEIATAYGFEKLDYTQIFSYTDGTKGTDDKNYPFDDFYEPDIYYLYKLGIINGKTARAFAPYDELTREEAAVILANTAKVLGKNVLVSEQSVSDRAAINSWAINSVNYTISAGIMTSVGGNQFAPKNKLTYEQAYTAALRLKDIK